ncbi:MAG TPA: VWA domain-containing protein [Pyrinomonadaceae bacterium]|nr:VWA domain-containing protein [Pyrinomonadaceae bacterium]
MKTPKNLAAFSLFAALLLLTAGSTTAFGQQTPPQDKTDDVVRISTELVQTGVTVVDKQGRFVDGLKPEQFELKVDGQPVTPSFFERVTAGTVREEKLAEAAVAAGKTAAPAAPAASSYRGRTIIFFVDDLHLSLDGLGRTRGALKHFIDEQMTPLDQVAFVSTTGQMGFLQQFTDNKTVLRAALERLKPVPMTTRDGDQPPMTEFVALRISNGDRQAAEFYIDKLLEGFVSKKLGAAGARQLNRNGAYEMVKVRANNIVFGVEAVTEATLTSLDNWVNGISQIPGRKLIFFISEGFYLDTRREVGGANAQLQRVTDTATRTGSVIYTIDARGLFAPMADATGDRPLDPKGNLDRATVGEGTISQDGLNALAGDTGGRFLRNQNYFDAWVTRMLDETSNYYLLAWRPPTEEQKGAKFKRIEVSIAGRPELTVRLPKGFLLGRSAADAAKAAKDKTQPAAAASTGKGPEGEIKSALTAAAPKKGLPTQLSVGFLDVPGTGPVLTASMQMATDVLGYGDDGKQPAAIDLAGVVLTEQGKPAGSFKTRLTVNPLAENVSVENPGVVYNNKVPLKPGLYQVRVAARDDRTGRVGSAIQWIEIPDLASKRLTLSSLMIGGQFVGKRKDAGAGDAPEQVQFSVDRRFKAGSHLNFLSLVYNATPGGGGAPDLEAQIKITRNGQAIVNTPARKISTPQGTDLARIPYGADIGLNNLPAGRYVLQLTINDRTARTTATQQATFDVE